MRYILYILYMLYWLIKMVNKHFVMGMHIQELCCPICSVNAYPQVSQVDTVGNPAINNDYHDWELFVYQKSNW